MRFSLPGIALSCLFAVAACSDGATNPTAPKSPDPVDATRYYSGTATIASVTLSPNPASVNVGATTQLTATIKDSFGRTVTGSTVTWESSNWNVAWVNASGVVTGKTAGTATISATTGGKTGTATVNVQAVGLPVASITLSPASGNIAAVGGTLQLTATLKDSLGNVLSGRATTWDSNNWNVAWVNASGLVTAKANGTAVISITSEGKSATATITVGGSGTTTTVASVASVSVSPASASLTVGQGTQLAATTKDSVGNVLTGRTITWSSSNTSVATVSASGYVSTVAQGTATITATSEGKSGSASITVNPVATVAVASVAVSPSSAALTVGQGTQLSATTKDASGNVLTGRTVTWTSSNTSVATVSSTGYVTSVAQGSATITATSEGKSGTASITVNPVPVASVTVTANSTSLTVGQTTQATATLKDANGNVLSGRTVTWSSSNAGVASVSSSGVITGVAAGSATITATSGGKSGSIAISVTAPAPAPVATVTVTPSSASLTVGQTAQLSATTKDANGNVLTGRTITWSSSNASVASVSSSGLVTAMAAGTATITATSETKSGSASVSVASQSTTTTAGSCPVPNLRGIQTFDSGKVDSLNASEGWYIFSPYNYAVIQDPTAHGGYSWQNSYTYNPGGDQGAALEGVFANHAQQKVYMRMRYKQDPTFDNSGIKKLMRFQGPQGLVGGIASMWGQFLLGLDVLSDGQNRGINVGAMVTPDDLKGSWHTYEFMADFTTAGHLKYKFWIDGQLKMDYDIPKSSNGATIYLAMFDGTWNAPGGTTKDWMDDNAVSTQCIGLQ